MAPLGKPMSSSYRCDSSLPTRRPTGNVIPGNDKSIHLEHLRSDGHRCKPCKVEHSLDRIVVFWPANTEQYSRARLIVRRAEAHWGLSTETLLPGSFQTQGQFYRPTHSQPLSNPVYQEYHCACCVGCRHWLFLHNRLRHCSGRVCGCLQSSMIHAVHVQIIISFDLNVHHLSIKRRMLFFKRK
jgi:hypothetical protein